MHPPIFVRDLSDPERAQLQASLRAPSAFTLRRAQIILASAAGHRPRQIASGLRCAPQTVRNAIHAFNANGLAALSAGSSRPKSAVPVLNGAKLEQLRALLHHSPRTFGLARSTWTLALLARVAHEQGLSLAVLSIETIRQALHRLKIRWRRAKHWLTSPDPAYTRKKTDATG
jgi:transposase